jgi:predicted nucleotidyltransferase component of viral defense system
METIEENKACYASQAQRSILTQLIMHPTIENRFFLTGGTALSVFYLHHRLSNDLDFFTLDALDLGEIDFWIKTRWPKENVKIKEGPQFLSLLIKEVKVDFVIDPLSINEEREKFTFENGHRLSIDTIDSIVSNKFCTIVSRIEPKDFIDFYMILKIFSNLKIETIYQQSRLKDAIFDDPPSAAFQVESGIAFLKENLSIMPRILGNFDLEEFFDFYQNVAKWLYDLVKKDI